MKLKLFVWLCACLPGLAACQQEPQPAPTPVVERAQGLTQAQLQQEHWLKSQEQPAPLAAVSIDWEAAARDRKAARLPGALQEKLDQVPIPVLMPQGESWRQSAFLTQGPGWHALSMDGEGLHLSLHALAQAVERPDLKEELGDQPLGQGPRTSHSHKIWTVSFTRYNVAYALDVECAQPGKDPRCEDPEAALEIYRGLELVGGAP